MIDLWTGPTPVFGSLGLTQRWINILGNVDTTQREGTLTYRWNDRPWTKASIGPDYHRLARQGDFNIEIPASSCRDGTNTLTIQLATNARTTETVKIPVVVHKKRRWPLPWSVDLVNDHDEGDLPQFTDGRWASDRFGLSVQDPYYDRVISFGDRRWKNYRIDATIIPHEKMTPGPLDGGRSVVHFAVALRWQGHDHDRIQPHRKWYPLGITAEFRLNVGNDIGSWRMLASPTERWELSETRSIEYGRPYRIVGEVFDLDDQLSRYRVKLWECDRSQPEGWDITVDRPTVSAPLGSALLVAHYSRISVQKICATPIDSV